MTDRGRVASLVVRERLRRALAGGVLAVVGWQAVLAAFDGVSELLAKPWSYHVRAFTASPEELVARRLGADFELLQALRAQAPGAALVRVSFLNRREDYLALIRRLTRLESLAYPIVLAGWPFDPARPGTSPAARVGQTARQELVLDLDSGRDYSAWPCEELARGPGFRLLRVGSVTRGEPSTSEAR